MVLLTWDQRVWTAFCTIFSGTLHLTKFGALKYAPKYAKYAFLAHILVRQVWSSGVSLKRSYRMQFRRVGLRWIGPSIYGSIMLKIYVCHSLTKLLQFFTWERGKKKFSWPTYCSCYQYIFKQLKTSNRTGQDRIFQVVTGSFCNSCDVWTWSHVRILL